MKVCITEKPSVARDIANILGATIRRDGYYEGPDVRVTWTFGHLCCLKEPHDYTHAWKHWNLSTLPMIPPRFGIKLIKDKGIEKQFEVIKTLVSEADEVINCGDAGQEGELIQRWVLQKAGIKCPVKRLWISSLTDDAIRAGFEDLRPEADYKNLYEAGLSRAIGDWLLGMNATRLYTLRFRGQLDDGKQSSNVLSIGRVQTPTLALIVERHKQIIQFKPQDYWEIRTLYRDTTFRPVKSTKYDDLEKAQRALEKITGKPLTITDITEKRGRESASQLFDLTSLQVECNKLHGWTAEHTLKLIQSLYEKKVTTYPRVDTTYLPDDLYPRIPAILRQMTPYASLINPILSGKIPKTKRIFDNAKVTDHHAIIPTGQSPSFLVGDERHLYHLIALRFIAAFYPYCIFSTTTVSATIGDDKFRATGKTIITPGWREVPSCKPQNSKDKARTADSGEDAENDNNNENEKILPTFEIGESGPHTPSLDKKTTRAPKPYTEGTLLRAMEGAGRLVEDEELREALKENGIGRPSTRAAIIETLFRRNYIVRQRRNIQPTETGIRLIDTIKTELLKSARLTGIWENKLRRIERGDYTASQFLDEIKTLVHEVVTSVLTY